MSDPFTVHAAYVQALEWNRAAFSAGHFEVAYHFLMAALHCAEDARDTAGLVEVGRLCGEQLRLIDANAPGQRFSSQSAQSRGHPSVFDMGITMADAAAQRLDAQGWLATHRAN
jgi:hypothetical protein